MRLPPDSETRPPGISLSGLGRVEGQRGLAGAAYVASGDWAGNFFPFELWLAIHQRSWSRRKAGSRRSTRRNIDELATKTTRAVERVGGAERGKMVIVLNAVEPPMSIRVCHFGGGGMRVSSGPAGERGVGRCLATTWRTDSASPCARARSMGWATSRSASA